MTVVLTKGNVSISVESWLKNQHPHSTVAPERYVELYRGELERDGWKIQRV